MGNLLPINILFSWGHVGECKVRSKVMVKVKVSVKKKIFDHVYIIL